MKNVFHKNVTLLASSTGLPMKYQYVSWEGGNSLAKGKKRPVI